MGNKLAKSATIVSPRGCVGVQVTHKEGQPQRQLVMLIEVRKVQYDLLSSVFCQLRVKEHEPRCVWPRRGRAAYFGDKAALEKGQEGPAGEERRSRGQRVLRSGDDGEQDDLGRDPTVGPEPFGQELRRELADQEAEGVERVSEVVVFHPPSN